MIPTVVVASGPSFSEDQAALIFNARDAGRCRIIAVNRSWERVPNADVLYVADTRWLERFFPEVEARFGGEVWTCNASAAARFGLCYIKGDNGAGLSAVAGSIKHGGNAGYQAIGLACHFDAGKKVLVGFDMQHTDGRRHWHDDYTTTIDATGKKVIWSNADGVKAWARHFPALANDAKARGIDVVNCSIETALTCFRRGDLAAELGVTE